MDGKGDGTVEGGEWELLQHSDDDSLLFAGPPLDSLRPDHFSLHPSPQPHKPNSSCSSNSYNSDVDRNFDDSYVADQLFPSPSLHPWNDSDSDATSTTTAATTAATGTILMPEPEGKGEVDVDVDLNSKEEEEEEEEEIKGEEGEKQRRLVVWWKVPFEVLKCWVNPLPLPLPVWSLSVAAAAAFLGLFFLGRRLYRMKRKTQTSFKLNLALDDKKVSQLMGRVARLNEAFSVVRRVPIVRPSLPATSVTLRPVMSMR